MWKEPVIEIQRQDPGKVSPERCQKEDQRQRADYCEKNNVVDQYPSSLERLHLSDHTGNPVS
jgi:hypothetical protein